MEVWGKYLNLHIPILPFIAVKIHVIQVNPDTSINRNKLPASLFKTQS